METKKIRILDIILFITAATALGFSLLRVIPFECTSETYIGVLVTLFGIGVTIAIGYQIFNVVEFKDKIESQQRICEELIIKNKQVESLLVDKTKELSKRSEELEIQSQKKNNEINEQLDILYAYNAYNSKSMTNVGTAFIYLHHSIIYGLNIEDRDFSSIFTDLCSYLVEMNKFSIGIYGSILKDKEGIPYLYDGKERTFVYELIDSYSKKVFEADALIKKNTNYHLIKEEYEKIMKHFRDRMEWFRINPNKDLTEEESQLILNN